MKGKQAALAANRRYETAIEHIDRLTTELVEAKRRARDAEEKAARYERQAGLVDSSLARNDELLVHTTRMLSMYTRQRKAVKDDMGKATQELSRRAGEMFKAERARCTHSDWFEFLIAHFPAFFTLISGGSLDDFQGPIPVSDGPYAVFERKLSHDDLRRFQRLVGERTELIGHPDVDLGVALHDVMEATTVGFTREEALVYAVGETT